MIYTAVVGGKDGARKDIKCFTNPYKFNNPRMNARMYKTLSHLFVKDEWSVWIDGNINLFLSEEELIEMTKPFHIGVFRHPERNCIYEEGEVCKKIGKDGGEIIDKQLNNYRQKGYPVHGGLGATFIVVRHNIPLVNDLNEKWWSHVCRYSLRDQISFPYVFGDYVKYLPKVPMRRNQYFERVKHVKSN